MQSFHELFSSFTCNCFSDRVRSSSVGKIQKPKKAEARSILSAKTEGEQLKAAIRSACFDDSCITGRRYSSTNALCKPERRPVRAPSCPAPSIADPCDVSGQRARNRRAVVTTDKSEELSQTLRPMDAPAAPFVQIEGGPEVPADLFASLVAAGRAANIRGQHRTELRAMTRSDGRRATVRVLRRMDLAHGASHRVA